MGETIMQVNANSIVALLVSMKQNMLHCLCQNAQLWHLLTDCGRSSPKVNFYSLSIPPSLLL